MKSVSRNFHLIPISGTEVMVRGSVPCPYSPYVCIAARRKAYLPHLMSAYHLEYLKTLLCQESHSQVLSIHMNWYVSQSTSTPALLKVSDTVSIVNHARRSIARKRSKVMKLPENNVLIRISISLLSKTVRGDLVWIKPLSPILDTNSTPSHAPIPLKIHIYYPVMYSHRWNTGESRLHGEIY